MTDWTGGPDPEVANEIAEEFKPDEPPESPEPKP
jgi:hypothetical protein